jgi:L-threonylcarbamoyladenylate synthase
VSPTLLLKIHPQQPEPHIIAQAAALIQSGHLVAFPTETVYGLGANALNPQAISRIFEAKGRPATDPLIVHISQTDQLNELALDIPTLAFELAENFWPGPLTLVLKRQPHVPARLSAGRDTVAIRFPAHPVARALIEAARAPIAAPSANLFSHPSPTTAAHVQHDLEGRIDLILDGGPTPVGVESTVLDLTTDTPTLLRPGGISLEALLALIPTLTIIERTLSVDESASSPGQLLKHYSPNARVLLFTGPREATLNAMHATAQQHLDQGKKLGALLVTEDQAQLANLPLSIFNLGSLTDLESVAHNLFTGLRDLDSQSLDFILARDLGRTGIGLAIWDRLFRAAEGRVITA